MWIDFLNSLKRFSYKYFYHGYFHCLFYTCEDLISLLYRAVFNVERTVGIYFVALVFGLIPINMLVLIPNLNHSVRAVVALNLHSYGSGRNPWGNLKPEYLEKVNYTLFYLPIKVAKARNCFALGIPQQYICTFISIFILLTLHLSWRNILLKS